MSTENRVKATLKNIEGKALEAIGNITGDPEVQIEGQEKQAEAAVEHMIENVKDKIKKVVE